MADAIRPKAAIPINASLKGITLRSALRLMLGEHDLNYIIDHEVLLITTVDKAKEKVVTKVYPVADLVLPIAINSGHETSGLRTNRHGTAATAKRFVPGMFFRVQATVMSGETAFAASTMARAPVATPDQTSIRVCATFQLLSSAAASP